MRRLAAFGLFVASLVVVNIGAVQAQAQTVDHYFGPYEVHFDSPECAFMVHWDISGQFHEVDFYDSSGTLTKHIATQGHGAVEITATAKGVTLGDTAPQNFVNIVTFNRDGSVATESFIGIFIQITVPGEGTVLAQIGRIEFDGEGNLIFQAGPNQDFSNDKAEFCAAFG
jgi:hypothetical protein